MTLRNNESYALCSICGGECCRSKPGIEAPEPFLRNGDPAESLARLLGAGTWVLDRHYGIGETEVVLYPRPATVEEHAAGGVLAAEGGGACVFLGEAGCVLSFEERPLMCRALEPDVHFECESSWSRPDAARSWLPHQQAVLRALALLQVPPPPLRPPWR